MGYIFGLSDAIIGLTVFAVGNSIADFVADFTVAQYAPIMGFSACFGGPMLNILLGVGISGSIVVGQTGQGYPLVFSHTLKVSAIGLLTLLVSTMVFVPWNGYFLSRKWGAALITFYVIIMVVNVIVEVKL
jgi:solute carrier family 24 (sodium/potassium/calcium exchanger), member 6